MITERKREYAHAIYEIAKENNLIKDYLNLSLAIIDMFNSNPQLNIYFSSSQISNNQKKELISKITNEYNFYKNWLLIIVDYGKSKFIKEYINEFINLYNKENNIIKGYAWTTKLIDSKKIKELEKFISKKINRNVMLENKIDNELIGGIKLQVEDDVWDNSIKNKLNQLLKEGSDNDE